MRVLIPTTFHYGFFSSLMFIFNNSPCVEYVWCDFLIKAKYNFPIFWVKHYFRMLVSALMLDNGFKTIGKDPVWRKFFVNHNKNLSWSYVSGQSGIWKARNICPWNTYIYRERERTGKQELMKRKTENNSNPIYIPRNSVSLILLYDNWPS